MEIILALLKYLTATLTPMEFLVLTALIGLVSFIAAKWAMKNKGTLLKLLGKDGGELKDIQDKLETLATKDDIVKSLDRLELIVRHEISENDKSIEHLTQKFVEISALRHEIMDKEFEELKEAIATFQAHGSHMLAEININSVAQARLLAQIENIDSSFKAGVIEFRGYHRELGQDLKMLSRDLALIERSFDLKINNGSAVKLR